MVPFTITTAPPPLRIDEEGAVRVGNTRVTLDTVINVYNDKVSPEEIIQRYDTLTLEQVYGVIAYYLREKEAIDAYLKQREIEAEELRRKWEAEYPPDPKLRERLLALKRERERVGQE